MFTSFTRSIYYHPSLVGQMFGICHCLLLIHFPHVNVAQLESLKNFPKVWMFFFPNFEFAVVTEECLLKVDTALTVKPSDMLTTFKITCM